MSPAGDKFRQRCAKFPAIATQASINWMHPWPKEALISVAKTYLERLGVEEDIINQLRAAGEHEGNGEEEDDDDEGKAEGDGKEASRNDSKVVELSEEEMAARAAAEMLAILKTKATSLRENLAHHMSEVHLHVQVGYHGQDMSETLFAFMTPLHTHTHKLYATILHV